MEDHYATAYLAQAVAGFMARVALALSSLALLIAALPTAQALADLDADAAAGCIGLKLTGDQALIARPYPGGGFEVFAGVDASSTDDVAPLTVDDGLGLSGDY